MEARFWVYLGEWDEGRVAVRVGIVIVGGSESDVVES